MKSIELLLAVTLMTIITATTLLGEDKMELSLMPVPAKILPKDGKFRLSESFAMALRGEGGPRLYAGATRALRRLSGRTGLFFSQDFITAKSQDPSAVMMIDCKRPGKLALQESESYRLTVTQEKIDLTAETDIGVLRGLETFLQLLAVDKDGYFFPALEIEDAPRFPWRGLLIDAGRHFMPVEVMKRNLEGMAAVKLNVLHWHLTEDQGFRVECKTFPKLHEMGSDGLYYTQAQITEVIDYAAERGIRVIPEFDMPGHSTSWFVGYPELASAPGPYSIGRKWGVMDPVMNPARNETYQFLDAFLKEMAALFPDEYLHIGGDENNGKHWNANAEIQAFMKANKIADNQALQAYFNNKILKILTKYGKKMVGWDEILHKDMPSSIVIQSWRGQEGLVKSARAGYQSILSNGYYIDLIQPTDFHYLNDPIPEKSSLSAAEQKFILGGEATMWSEYVDPENVDSRIWPRTAAIAERLWSPGSIKDVDDMYRRLEVISFRLEELGLTHEKNYPMKLRRLTNNTDIVPLKNLIDVIEPVKIYTREEQHDYTSFSPLTRVVDAARPDAKIARNFRRLVDDFLASKNQGNAGEINSWLQLWKSNHERLTTTIRLSPVLTEIETLSADLSSVAEIGLEAMAFIADGRMPNEAWTKEKLQSVEKAKAPRGQTELMIVSAIEKLVKAAGKQ